MTVFTYEMLSKTINWVCPTLGKMVYKSRNTNGAYATIELDKELYISPNFQPALIECINVWNTSNTGFHATWSWDNTITIRVFFMPTPESKKIPTFSPGTILGSTTKWNINIPQQ